MNTLLILFAQTKSMAIFEITALLVVAAVIGFVTAWFYANSNSDKEITGLEFHIDEDNRNIRKLNVEKSSQQESVIKKDNKISQLTRMVEAVEVLHKESVHEADEMKLQNKRTEQKLIEKDEALTDLVQRMHVLNYNSFGTASEDEKDDLQMISGIGSFIEVRLHTLKIFTFRQISKFTQQDIETIDEAIEYFSGRIERDEWVTQAKELVIDDEKRTELLEKIRTKKSLIYYDRIGVANKEEAEDLTSINGIGGWINEKLNALDIYTFRQISNFTKDDIEIVTHAIEFFPGRIERDEWIHQAGELIRIQISKADHLERISAMKNSIYYDRLGLAHKHHANNLTLIKGISSWIEERLNMLDIYTFEQVSKLTREDIEIVSDIIEIAPNRIQQDNWIEQARRFTS